MFAGEKVIAEDGYRKRIETHKIQERPLKTTQVI